MSRAASRLERLFGDGATAFGAAFDLVPDPVGVWWAIREPGGAIADFETGYSNPAKARMIGVATEASIGRRLLEEAPELREDETFTRMRDVLERGRPEVVEVAMAEGPRHDRHRAAPRHDPQNELAAPPRALAGPPLAYVNVSSRTLGGFGFPDHSVRLCLPAPHFI